MSEEAMKQARQVVNSELGDERLKNIGNQFLDIVEKNESLQAENARLKSYEDELAATASILLEAHPANKKQGLRLREVATAAKDAIDENARLRESNEKLKAIVDKLPKTADGVPVVPSVDAVWARCDITGVLVELTIIGVFAQGKHYISQERFEIFLPVYECYSTQEAAEAAGKDGE